MSGSGDDGNKKNNSKPLVEHPENYEASVNVCGSMEVLSSAEPRQVSGAHSTAGRQVKDASNQTESSRVQALRDKWEEVGKKTYSEIASALPGGAERYTYEKHVHCGNSSQVPTTPEQQFSSQHFEGVVKNPLQEYPEQGLQSLPGSSNQGCLCQGSNPPALAEYDSKEQQLQGFLLQGSTLHGHFEVMLHVIASKLIVIH